MSYTLHPGASSDIREAGLYYRREGGHSLSERFIDEFSRIAKLLSAEPGLGTPAGADRRWFPLRGFPYTVIYRPDGAGVRILVLRHQQRDPQHGEHRR